VEKLFVKFKMVTIIVYIIVAKTIFPIACFKIQLLVFVAHLKPLT